nr:immunity 22 family protein [uncultured Flavobacterium sp.]
MRIYEPNFQCDANVVSIWLATAEYNDIPENYWVENFEDEDAPWNQFSDDFGFGYYDVDSAECFFDDKNHLKISVFDLVKYLSYSKSFIHEAIEKAEALSQKESSYAYLIYNFDYDASVTGISKSSFFTYLGTFAFDINSDAVENFFNG